MPLSGEESRQHDEDEVTDDEGTVTKHEADAADGDARAAAAAADDDDEDAADAANCHKSGLMVR